MKLNQQMLITRIWQRKTKTMTNLKQRLRKMKKMYVKSLTHVAQESTCGHSSAHKRVNLLCGLLVLAGPVRRVPNNEEEEEEEDLCLQCSRLRKNNIYLLPDPNVAAVGL